MVNDEGPLSLLNELDNLLEDYEYYDTPTPTPSPPPSLPAFPGSSISSNFSSINSLVLHTNHILLEINNQQKLLDTKVEYYKYYLL